jgi:hypothetical protein
MYKGEYDTLNKFYCNFTNELIFKRVFGKKLFEN